MKKSNFKLCAALLLLSLLAALSAASCSRPAQPLTAAEAARWVNDNGAKALFVYAIFNGNPPAVNIAPEEDGGWVTEGGLTWAPYINNAQDLFTIKNIAGLKKLTESVYTKEYADANFYKPFLEASAADGSLPRYKDIEGKLYVNVKGNTKELTAIEWETNTLTVASQDGETALLNIKKSFGLDASNEGSLKIRKAGGQWRLDCSIYGAAAQ